MKKKKAGFTLIEMMIVLVLTVIILGIMGTIFLTGNRVFSDTDVKSDLQIEGQTTHETLSNLGMQGVGIKKVDNIDFESKDASMSEKKNDMIDKQNLISIHKIIINVAEKESDPKYPDDRDKDKVSNKAYTFELKDKELSMTKSGSGSGKILSTNVESFKIKPSDTGVEFEINLKKKKAFADEKKYPIKVDVLFRNKDAILDTQDTQEN